MADSRSRSGGFQVHQLEGLTRYETHLDRKFERTLANAGEAERASRQTSAFWHVGPIKSAGGTAKPA
jgi:hypothetical protein